MDLKLKDKVAIITGGASGIGLETARYMVGEGVRVLIADRDADRIPVVIEELRGLGGKVEAVNVDVGKMDDCQRMAAEASETFGAIDILVASAGICRDTLFLESNPEDWDAMISVNLRGVLNTNYTVAPVMVKQGHGSIINIASEAAKLGEKRLAVYGATKGAIASFSKAFAIEMGRFNVRVNAVCPAVTMTPMTLKSLGDGLPENYKDDPQYQAAAKLYPLGRLGEPEDMAAMITFLASEQCSWVTGQAVSVNGGFGRS